MTRHVFNRVKRPQNHRGMKRMISLLLCAGMLQPLYVFNAADEEVIRYQPGDVIEVQRGEFIMTREQTPGYYLPKQEVLFFEHENATLASIEIRSGQMVQEGDVLMTFNRQEDLVATESSRIRLEQVMRQAEQNEINLQERITELRKTLAEASESFEKSRLAIEVKIAEENLRWQRVDSEKTIKEIQDEIAMAADDQAVTTVVAPFAGQVVDITGRKIGDKLNAWEYMCRLIGQEPFLLEVDNSSGEYRQGSTVTIEHGRAKERRQLTAKVVADHSLLGPELVGMKSWIELEGIDPAEAMNVINPRIFSNTHQVDDVIVVPRRAVTRQNQLYYVNLRSETGIQRRYIEIINWNQDDYWVQDGLAVGDKIVIE